MAKRIFGHITGYYEESAFENRTELSFSGVHRPTQAGISGSQNEGADSIILSGGYEDDKDFGNVIIYTGHGGRDLTSGKQVTDQLLVRQNLALAKNCQTGLPVRVIRGANHKSKYSPKAGYRYDGLYRVEEYWQETGRSGYKVWRFRLSKIQDLEDTSVVNEDWPEYNKTKRVSSVIQRIVRDTELSRAIKELYNFKCQVCDVVINTNSGNYAEAAHIKPLGQPHNGPDILENLLCLCPNHHVMFDFGGFAINEDLTLLGLNGKLKLLPSHKLDIKFLKYHKEHFFQK